MADNLSRDLYAALCAIPLIDPHSHIDPFRPVARSLDDILGYHYYTELARSAGMPKDALADDVAPRDRVKSILGHMGRFDNTVQYSWFLEIAKQFLGFTGDRISAADADSLFDTAKTKFAQSDWEKQVFEKTKLEAIFLTNEFDDELDGFDPKKYVPCLRTDSLVFHLDKPRIRERLADATGVEVGDAQSLRKALWKLFARFKAKGAKACAISLPPVFSPTRIGDQELDRAVRALAGDSTLAKAVFGGVQFARSIAGTAGAADASPQAAVALGTFWMLADHCREFELPFDLMIGVNRRVYEAGVYQGQDLFDGRTSLIQYRELFNAFPEVTFPISVLTSGQNQELVAYSWIFPNVMTNGHWWYSNVPAYIRGDLTERLQAVPKTKQIGYYSDAYKLEFVLPKYNMYRGILADALADEFVRPGRLTETEAAALGKRLLRDNVREIFGV
ncbi:MAG TPA: glucuronate isomerase [Gemmataceae bacterium]|nr:glucuronate isomerase [Gemmataceae bacterium]